MPISPAPRAFFHAPHYLTPDDLFDFERDAWRTPYDLPLGVVPRASSHSANATAKGRPTAPAPSP
jgi:hypothetical protein